MKRLVISTALAFFLGLAGTGFAGDSKTAAAHADEAPAVSLSEMKKIVETKSAFIIDCNSEKVFNEGHIPGAVNFANHEGKLTSILPNKATPVVAYCGGTMCTAWEGAAKEAKAAGYTNIRHFKEGIKGWKDAKLQLEKGPVANKS